MRGRWPSPGSWPLRARAEQIRAAVEEVLPSRAATDRAGRSRSLADVEAFRKAVEVLRQVQQAGDRWRSAAVDLEEGVLLVAEANARYHRDEKVAALREARARIGRAVGRLLVEGGHPLVEPVPGWLRTLETEVLPLLAGLSRWAERLPGRAS